MNVNLLLVDPQNDFCSPSGSLYVTNAQDDCKRLAEFINTYSASLSSIYMTLDGHPLYHIAHPFFWVNAEGGHPAPYTAINHEDIENGIWKPVDASLIDYVKQYTISLESSGKYELFIWPPHCLMGSWGRAVEERVLVASRKWEEEKPGRVIGFFEKSYTSITEHYSVLQAEVVDPTDDTTKTNYSLIDALKKMDVILIAGEALSHCVLTSLKDLVAYIDPKKFILLSDCSSLISGFESETEKSIAALKQKGVQFLDSTSSEIRDLLSK